LPERLIVHRQRLGNLGRQCIVPTLRLVPADRARGHQLEIEDKGDHEVGVRVEIHALPHLTQGIASDGPIHQVRGDEISVFPRLLDPHGATICNQPGRMLDHAEVVGGQCETPTPLPHGLGEGRIGVSEERHDLRVEANAQLDEGRAALPELAPAPPQVPPPSHDPLSRRISSGDRAHGRIGLAPRLQDVDDARLDTIAQMNDEVENHDAQEGDVRLPLQDIVFHGAGA